MINNSLFTTLTDYPGLRLKHKSERADGLLEDSIDYEN